MRVNTGSRHAMRFTALIAPPRRGGMRATTRARYIRPRSRISTLATPPPLPQRLIRPRCVSKTAHTPPAHLCLPSLAPQAVSTPRGGSHRRALPRPDSVAAIAVTVLGGLGEIVGSLRGGRDTNLGDSKMRLGERRGGGVPLLWQGRLRGGAMRGWGLVLHIRAMAAWWRVWRKIEWGELEEGGVYMAGRMGREEIADIQLGFTGVGRGA